VLTADGPGLHPAFLSTDKADRHLPDSNAVVLWSLTGQGGLLVSEEHHETRNHSHHGLCVCRGLQRQERARRRTATTGSRNSDRRHSGASKRGSGAVVLAEH